MTPDTNGTPDLSGRVLDIGCGERKKRPDYVGIDMLDYPGVDVVGDVFEVLADVPDSVVAGVYSSHFFEHMPAVTDLLDEVARVIRPGGFLEVITPHFSNSYYYSDATHTTPFGLYSFSYWSVDEIFSRRVPTYKRDLAFRLDDVHLTFKAAPPFYVRYAGKRLLELLVNSSTWTKEFYEENLAFMLPCYELRYRLTKLPGDG